VLQSSGSVLSLVAMLNMMEEALCDAADLWHYIFLAVVVVVRLQYDYFKCFV